MMTVHDFGNKQVEGAYWNLIRALRHEDTRREREADAFADLGGVVYYLWRAPYIKIGYSSDLRARLYSLHASPRDLLAIQPGSRQDEADMHARFTSDRVHGNDLGREHFWPSQPLLAHINDLRARCSMPRLAVALMPDQAPQTPA